MNLLAILGSARKGKATETLVDKAIEGATGGHPNCSIKKLHLYEYDIKFCRNCLVCRDRNTDEPISECTIRDDMDEIVKDVLNSDYLIFGTPVHMGYTPGIMTTFLERICWTFAKPGKQFLTVKGCPMPRRTDKERQAIIIVVSGSVPPVYRRLCDAATPLIKQTIADSLNAKTVSTMYAGAVELRGVERYLNKAKKLGKRLTKVCGGSQGPCAH